MPDLNRLLDECDPCSPCKGLCDTCNARKAHDKVRAHLGKTERVVEAADDLFSGDQKRVYGAKKRLRAAIVDLKGGGQHG